MQNPILQALRQSPPQSNPLAMVARFKEFARGMTPEHAKQLVEEKLRTGEMSQAQFEQLKSQAQDFMRLLQ